MSELRDFIKANILDHNETFCIERWKTNKIKTALDRFGISYTCWGWYPDLPEEMDALYDEPKRMYALFTGPFIKNAVLYIHDLMLSDVEKEQWLKDELERWTEALKVPGLVGHEDSTENIIGKLPE